MDVESELAGNDSGSGGKASRPQRPDPFGSEVLDLEVIDRLRELGGEDQPELVFDLIRLFLTDAHDRLAEMRRALREGDLDAIARIAHTLKGSSGSLGAVQLAEVCREVEELARRSPDLELEAKARSCFETYERTEEALKRIEP